MHIPYRILLSILNADWWSISCDGFSFQTFGVSRNNYYDKWVCQSFVFMEWIYSFLCSSSTMSPDRPDMDRYPLMDIMYVSHSKHRSFFHWIFKFNVSLDDGQSSSLWTICYQMPQMVKWPVLRMSLCAVPLFWSLPFGTAIWIIPLKVYNICYMAPLVFIVAHLILDLSAHRMQSGISFPTHRRGSRHYQLRIQFPNHYLWHWWTDTVFGQIDGDTIRVCHWGHCGQIQFCCIDCHSWRYGSYPTVDSLFQCHSIVVMLLCNHSWFSIFGSRSNCGGSGFGTIFAGIGGICKAKAQAITVGDGRIAALLWWFRTSWIDAQTNANGQSWESGAYEWIHDLAMKWMNVL